MKHSRNFLSIVLLFLFLPFVSAVDISIVCPDKVVVNEDFSCEVKASGISGVYDLKIELKDGGKTIARIFDSDKDKWSSAYYYLKGFLEKDETKKVQLRIEQIGEFTGVVKVRAKTPQEIGTFEINVVEANGKPSDNEQKDSSGKKEKDSSKALVAARDDSVAPPVVDSTVPVVFDEISLSGSVVESVPVSDSVVFESKSAVIVKFVPFALSLFLLVVIVLLVIKR